jgi:16S rRNA (uracil1498-N3)-methyltransferase
VTVALPVERSHYLSRVLRLDGGAPLCVFGNDGAEYAAVVESLTSRRAQLRIGEATGSLTESPLATWLVQGLCRTQRMDYCVQKATEVGVTRLVPVVTQRCVVRLDAAKAARRVAHWRGIAIGACEQSGRVRIPHIEPPQTLADLLARNDRPPLAVLDPDAGDAPGRWQVDGGACALLIGPEGGLTEAENAQALAAGAARWRMGPRILRTETAGVVALALLQMRFGDLD